MEGIGSEVSHKIRAAIKAKLIELGAYVDDELPDYIMVMVANKRTRAQMDEDLHLFLSSNTKIFTSWLHTVLQKLQEVTVASFENKKENDSKKSSKRKKSEGEDTRSVKSFEEGGEKVKKRPKKHKETKKLKKNKYKHKEKTKSRKSEKEDSKEREKSAGEENERKEKEKGKKVQLNEVVGKAILGDLKKEKKVKSEKEESSSESCSSSEEETNIEEKSTKENGKVADINKKGEQNVGENVSKTKEKTVVEEMECSEKNKKNVVEDEFNIEPLKPAERENETESQKSEQFNSKKGNETSLQIEKTISAPTEELLKEHNKIENERLKGEESSSQQKKHLSDSEESLSPEEIRKQLLLSRAKKKLEESKKAERMRSNSPDVLIVEDSSGFGGRQKDLTSASSRQLDIRSTRSTHSGGKESSKQNSFRRSRRSSIHSDRSQSSERSPYRKGSGGYKSKPSERKSPQEDTKKVNETKTGKSSFQKEKDKERERERERDREREKERERDEKNGNGEKKRNIIKISETLEKEKSLAGRRETDLKTKEKEENRSRKRVVSSRVVTIAAPEAPEIPSVIKVKPREFLSKDKQANKALILKAVAEAEKSIATLHARPEILPEPKKEALYTKNLREKRYEKLAITLSNIRRSPDSRDRSAPSRPLSLLRSDRRISVESEKSDRSRQKRDSSDVSEGVKAKSDLLSKKISKSEDQFISSKTTIMEKNEKYIRCWLEGVEKAVKEDEMLNPSEMEDFVHSNPTDEENDATEKDEEKKRKRKSTEPSGDSSSKTLKLSEKEIANLRMIPDAGSKSPEGPQIVVTLDGLDTKAIKDLILKNKESSGRPLLSSSGKKSEKTVSKDKSPGKTDSRKTGFEKMSDRFGRLNKVNEHGEDTVTKSENKSSKRESGDTEKKKVATESKNRQLIAQLSEKFGKIDREFESRKRKRPDEDRRYPYDSRRGDKDGGDRNGRYRKSERRSFGFYRRS